MIWVLGACLVLAIGALAFILWTELRHSRDERTATRLERAELLQRIQAPTLAVTQHAAKSEQWYGFPTEEERGDEDIEREWHESTESVIPFDDDLADQDEGAFIGNREYTDATNEAVRG